MIIKSVGRKGRGVFTTQSHKLGELVIRNPILPIKKTDQAAVNETVLHNYAFYISSTYMICLGHGCLLNHSADANLWYCFNKHFKTLDFYANRRIKKGEELTIDYGWDSYPWMKK